MTLDIGQPPEVFVRSQVEQGRFSSPSEVVRAALRLLEEQEARLLALRAALVAGEESGEATPFDVEAFLAENRAAFVRPE